MGIRENIIKLRKLYKITQEELAEIANVSRSAVSQWEGGFSEPRMGAIERIAMHFGLRKSHIIEDGGMDLIDPITLKPKPYRPSNALPVVAGENARVPLYGTVHAGKPTEPDLFECSSIEIPKFLVDSDPDCYALQSEGDCMNRVYPEGCVIVVSPNKQPINGSVAVVSIDGQDYLMRRLYRTANTLVLSPDSFNPDHEDIVITNQEDHIIEFGGKVVWFQSKEEME